MATKDNVKNQEDLTKALQEGKITAEEFRTEFEKLTAAQKESNEEIETGLDSFKGYRDLVSSINEEMGKKISHVKEASKGYSNLTSIAQKFQNQEEEITRLTDAQLKLNQEKAHEALREIKDNAEKLAQQKQINTLDKNGNELSKEALAVRLQAMVDAKKLTDEEKALLLARQDNFKLEEELLGKVDQEIEKRKISNDLMGVAGGLIKSANQFLGPFASSLKLDEARDAMQEVADELAEAGENAGSFSGKLKVLGAGIQSMAGNLVGTLTDPAVIFGAVMKSYGDYAKAAKDVRQETGMSAVNLGMVATSAGTLNADLISTTDALKAISALTKETGINVAGAFSADTINAAAELSEFAGLGAKETANLAMQAEFTGESLSTAQDTAINLTKEYASQKKGLFTQKQLMEAAGSASQSLTMSIKGGQEGLMKAAAEASRLGINLSEAENIADKLLEFESSIANELEAELLTGKQLNLEKAREAALNNDIATMTKEIGDNQEILSAFSSGNRIQQEAIAKSLGMSKDQVAKMIFNRQKENNLTDEQARKMAGISKEEANRISFQDKLAKIMDKLTAAVAPLLDIVASVLDKWYILYPLLGVVALSTMPKIVQGAKGFANSIKEGYGAVKSVGKGIMDFGKGFMGATGQGKGFFSKVKEGFSAAKKGAGAGADATKKAADAAKGASAAGKASSAAGGAAGGLQIRLFFQNLAAGLRSMGSMKVLAGIGNTILFAPAAVLMVAAIPFLSFIGLIKLPFLRSNLNALGQGLTSLSTGLVGVAVLALAGPAMVASLLAIPFLLFMGLTPLAMLQTNFTSLGQGLLQLGVGLPGVLALGLLGPAGALAALSIPFLAFMAIPGIGIAISTGLGALGTGLATLGGVAATGLPFIAIGAIAALGVAIIPFAVSLRLVTPLVEAFGNVIVNVLGALPPVIEAVANGIVTVFGGIGDLITKVVSNLASLADPSVIAGLYMLAPALVALGLSFVPLAYGLGAFTLATLPLALMSGGNPFGVFLTLAEAAPGIELAAKSLSTLGSSSVIDGLTNLSPALMDFASVLNPLSIALVGFGLSTALLSLVSGGNGPFGMFIQLSEAAPGIDLAASAITKMTVALGELQSALDRVDSEKLNDIMSPSLGGVVLGLGSAAIKGVTDTVSSIFGEGGGEESNPNEAVVAELQAVKEVLNQILNKEGSVIIDTSRAGTAFALGTSKLQ